MHRSVLDCILMCNIAAILVFTPLATHAAPVQSGKATVDWITESETYQPGAAVVTGFRMVLDPGWHTYWINPGEGGMAMSAKFKLPDGWKAEGPAHPLPLRFKTGELFDFGYEGTVIFPITLHPPANAKNEVEIQATFSWLTCDASACIPGDATVNLTLRHGVPSPSANADAIAAAVKTVPVPAAAPWSLKVISAGDPFELHLTPPPGLDPGKSTTFPLTENLIHPGAVFAWKAKDGVWTCRVPKSPYAPESLEKLDLVIHAPSLETPVIVTWTAD
jgi:thiol:disulfide interchange protein DsbD